ncbi:MAG: hypothetical protein ACO4AI_16200 [Prochlorothrix sp.]
MPRFSPYNLRLEISRMFSQGQGFFAEIKVQDWLKAHNQDPTDYIIQFQEHPAPPGSSEVIAITIDLQRKDGQAVDPWLLEELNGA